MAVLRILEIISLITTCIGLYLLGERNPVGFLIFTVSLVCQIHIFAKQNNWFLVIQMVILIIFNVFNYFKWLGLI